MRPEKHNGLPTPHHRLRQPGPAVSVLLACSVVLACWSVTALVGLSAQGAAPQQSLNSGISYYNRGQIQKALPLLRNAAAAAPSNANIQLWYAKALMKQGGSNNFNTAKNVLFTSVNADPTNGEAMMLLGEILSWDPGQRDQAIHLLRGALDRQDHYAAVKKNAAKTTRTLVELLIWDGQYSEAATLSQPIRNTFASDKKWQATYANLLSHLGQADQAVELYENFIKPMGTKQYNWQVEYVYALTQAGQTEKAKAVFEEIRGPILASKNADWINALSGVAYETGNFEGVIELDAALPENMQNNRELLMRRTRAYKELRRNPEAIDTFQQVYGAGQLTPNEKVEYGDFLLSLNLPSASLPEPNLIERLYTDALNEVSDPDSQANVQLRLGRLYQTYGDNPDTYTQSIKAYISAYRALGSPDVKREMLDAIKNTKANPGLANDALSSLLGQYPDDLEMKGEYAEFLSWQPDRRSDAILTYLALSQEDPVNGATWAGKLEEVMGWHRPSLSWMPIYDQVLAAYPNSKNTLLGKARAYATDPGTMKEALTAYQDLKTQYPDDAEIAREWLGVISSDERRQPEAMRLLKGIIDGGDRHPSTLVAYAKLLSYRGQYRPALKLFNEVLAQDPEFKDALVGKGYTLMWAALRLEARDFLTDARSRYPDDPDIALALAEAYRILGRHDKALEILEEVRPAIKGQSSHWEDGLEAWPENTNPAFIPVENVTLASDYDWNNVTFDFMVTPQGATPAAPTHQTVAPGQQQPPIASPRKEQLYLPTQTQPSQALRLELHPQKTGSKARLTETQRMAKEVDSLQQAIESLKAIQEQSHRQIERLESHVQQARGSWQDAGSVMTDDAYKTANTNMETQGSLGGMEPGLTYRYGQGVSLDYPPGSELNSDTGGSLFGPGTAGGGANGILANSNPSGSALNQLERVDAGLFRDLRPELRGGFAFQFQEGERTTSRLHSWGFPNQVSLSVLPQLRVRGGIVPRQYYLPRSPLDPSRNFGTLYTWGFTTQPWDRVKLDADMGITHFSQSDVDNITWRSTLDLALHDRIHWKIGGRRQNFSNSLLSIAGFQPDNGPHAGRILGPANENAVFTELNFMPLLGMDLNLGYEFALVTGRGLPDNTKNQFFVSTGYTHKFNQNHSIRAGYEFLWFGFDKNATNGYFGLDGNDPRPLAILAPRGPADGGYVFGGYFSPSWFVLNAWRLDYRGSLFNKFLEYKLGGSLGVQAFEHGNGIDDTDPTSLATAFNISVQANFTDWLSAYGITNYQNSGGLFSRWRFEGGFILRPNIQALTPIFGNKPEKPTRLKRDRTSFPDADFDTQAIRFYN